ncbi:MAG: peptidylprolyl isomerase [Gammaproteobacteria bacterium]|nr:peptidylprolyl isomerase [Gammaproteobacteria bacterium]
MHSKDPFSLILGAALLLFTAMGATAAEIDASHPVATVGTQTITAGAFVQQVRQGMRQRFYHGKIPEGELEQFGDEVLQGMIDRALLLQEAKKRQLQPDHKAIEAQLAGYEEQYAQSERWQQERAARLPQLRAQLEEQGLLKALEAEVRQLPPPTEPQVRDYYRQHPDKFTTPQKVRVSLILLKVDPSSPTALWQGAMEEGRGLVEKLRQGDDFATLAALHSGDASAENGGDLGYLHQGMLAPEAQQAIDGLKPGEIAEPLRLLQGVAIFRLDDRIAERLNPFERVKDRAGELLARDNGDGAWRTLATALRQQTPVAIDQQTLKTLFTPAEGTPPPRQDGAEK